ncbi:hypothetical protein NDN11_13455 [Acinetobacter sp. C26M]|uniref:hypothetical protein n=1 Tax=unclassified Acinetobacter TaxID=196816 RepID=UPI002036CE4C|nr:MULTISPECIES: hypothetical protein [unclassified Acinetobacter]USA45714.1 hypothetical protein NDN11_13455 [Acinetobacter sp. C26M]USA49213.1 hypothetical protein NDN12_13455 [Acinetobacter sp. C26G]
MGSYELTKYDHFINAAFIKYVKSELIVLVFLLACFWMLIPAVFNSDRWVVIVFNFNISLYYLYPVVLGFICLLYIFKRIFKYYSRSVFHFYFKDEFLVLNIFEFKSVQFVEFDFVLDKYSIGHWNGFKKEYFNCVGIEGNKKVYLLPVADGKMDELVKLLLDHGGKQL